MKRPNFPNLCSERGQSTPQILPHETLMVPSPILHEPLELGDDGVFSKREGIHMETNPAPTEGQPFLQFGYLYPDDDGGSFWLINSVCGHCGHSFTITKDYDHEAP